MDVILLAAGTGSRMNLSFPKQFYEINGKPFFIYSLETISKMDNFDNIIKVQPCFNFRFIIW